MTSLLIVIVLLALAAIVQIFLRPYAFTAWVLAGVGAALCYPQAFQVWWGFKLTVLIVPLIQIIMFGVGTTMNAGDFFRVVREPWPVFVGILLQFSVMPLTGFALAKAFGLSGELAAGVILIGACSGGLASNVMCYLAGANVPLSVTMTCISTFLAPFLTPLALRLLAGEYLEVDTEKMMLGVLNIIIVPVLAGLSANAILYSARPIVRHLPALCAIAVMTGGLAAGVACGMLPDFLSPLRGSLLLGFVLLIVVTVAKMILSILLGLGNRWMDRALPAVSMAGIWAVLVVITAQTHDVLIQVGLTVVVIGIAHNTVGYFLGYWGAWTAGKAIGRIGFWLGMYPNPSTRVDERDCRTVAFEVGMQNGGMATGLAVEVFKSHIMALPANVFGTWQNISGSLLANYWKTKTPS